MAPMLSKVRPLIRSENFKSISTFIHLRQEADLAEPPIPPPQQSPLPSNPATGSPVYSESWRNPIPTLSETSLIPIGYGVVRTNTARMQLLAKTLNAKSLQDQFGKWIAEQRWADIKELFESWIRTLDGSGQPNKPDVSLYNQYVRANFMMGALAAQLLDLVAQMDAFGIIPNTASYNLVLKAMQRGGEIAAAEKLMQRFHFVVKLEIMLAFSSFSRCIYPSVRFHNSGTNGLVKVTLGI